MLAALMSYCTDKTMSSSPAMINTGLVMFFIPLYTYNRGGTALA